MPLVEKTVEGPFETSIIELAHGRLRFQWIVVDRTREHEPVSGRASSSAHARHDARSTVNRMRGEAGSMWQRPSCAHCGSVDRCACDDRADAA